MKKITKWLKSYLVGSIIYCSVLIVLFLGLNYLSKKSENYLVNSGQITDFAKSVKEINGGDIQLSDYKGQYLLLDFWFLGCDKCLAEMQSMNSLIDKNKGLSILSITFDNVEKVTQSINTLSSSWYFLSKRDKNRWRLAYAGKHDGIIKNLNISSYPTYVLVSPEGKILMRTNNGMFGLEKYMDGVLPFQLKSLDYRYIWLVGRVNLIPLFICYNILFLIFLLVLFLKRKAYSLFHKSDCR